MLLPHTPLKGVIEKAERIRKVVKEYQFMGLEEKDRITVSIGIACASDEKIKTPDDLITFADNALYTAKDMGRDQIVVYPQL
jgi:diguanylate cyclase (GGDEF)-like protein